MGDGQHWRSKYYQAHDRYETLKKETSRRKSIHEELEAAFMDDPDKLGRSFEERSAQAAIRAESRKRKKTPPAAAPPDGSS